MNISLFKALNKNPAFIFFIFVTAVSALIVYASLSYLQSYRARIEEDNRSKFLDKISKDISVPPVDKSPEYNEEILNQMQVQTWVYPGENKYICNAISEASNLNRKINVLKPEYFTLSEGKLKLLDENFAPCNTYSNDQINKIKEISDQQFVTVSSHVDEMRLLFASKSNINNAIDILVEFVSENDMTGVEIDFESFSSWTSEDYEDYKSFIEDLGNSLNSINKKLIIDTPPITNDIEESYYLWDYSDFNELPVSQFVVMLYDYQADQGVGNAIAPNSWVIDGIRYVKEKIEDDSKIVIGIPSYGYYGDNDTFEYKIVTKSEMNNLFPNLIFDAESENSFERSVRLDGVFYTIIDSRGLQSKLQLIYNEGIRNVSVWHLGGNDWF